MKTSALLLSFLLSFSAVSQTAIAASERIDILGTSTHSSSSNAPGKNNPNSSVLSPEAMQLAAKLGLIDDLQRLKSARLQSGSDLQSKFELQVCKQDVTESVVIAIEELRTVVARIDSELGDASEVHAHLAERRDKAVRINTYANLISGGITGIVGGGLQISDVPHINYDIIDTTEGVVQSALAGWALQQQRGEKRIEGGAPNLLMHLMNRSPDTEKDYPPSVWAYLNLSNRHGKPVIASLVDRWFQLHLCLKHSGHREKQASRILRISNTVDGKITIDVLEDRMAMLTDLRACVQQMDYLLLELMQLVHGRKSLPDT